MTSRSISRRTFLRRAGGLGIGLMLTPLAGCESHVVEPVITGSDLAFLTETDDFFVQFGGATSISNWPGVQRLTIDDWSLQLGGLFARPQTLRFSDLQAVASKAVTVVKTMRCVVDANYVPGLVGTATWTGIPLRLFLDRAGIDLNRTRRLRVFGADGFANNLVIDRLYGPEAASLVEPLLVYEMNGQPLTAEHGFPVRLLVQEMYGFKNVKWVTRIEATSSDAVFGQYQTVLGFADDGVIQVASKATNPIRGETIPAGPVLVTGYAVSGTAGITEVAYAIDGGAFAPAMLHTRDQLTDLEPRLRGAVPFADESFRYPYPGVWSLWHFIWQATPGDHLIRIRATDAAGYRQPEQDVDPTDGSNPVFELPVTVAPIA